MTSQTAIPCLLMRGGTSKGPFFNAADLPADTATRDKVLLAALGSPDKRQIDGLGGAHPLTSTVGIVRKSSAPGVDIDFLFAQLQPDKDTVDTSPNCGNMLAAAVPFALETGLLTAQGFFAAHNRLIGCGDFAGQGLIGRGRNGQFALCGRDQGIGGGCLNFGTGDLAADLG